MGSCFKFKMCRKQGYDFNSQAYDAAPVPTGTYRASTLEMEGWDPNVALATEQEKTTVREQQQVNGETLEDKETEQVTAVVSSPSHSDVTFGGNLANEQEEEEKAQNEKGSKSNKKKKEKEKEKKSKKEKSKKKSKNKKKKGKDDDAENTENEMTEKENKDEKREDDKKDETGDISNMETLPRDEKHIITAVETTTVMASGGDEQTETTVTETTVLERVEEKLEDSENKLEEQTNIAIGNEDTRVEDVDLTEKRNVGVTEIVVEEIKPEVHVVTTTIVTEPATLSDSKQNSALDHSHSEEEAEIDKKGSDEELKKSDEEGVDRYPEPDEQIDVINTVNDVVVNGDVTEEGGTLIERTTKTVQETSNYGATVTVTKVVTETVEKHGDVAETITAEISDEVAKL